MLTFIIAVAYFTFIILVVFFVTYLIIVPHLLGAPFLRTRKKARDIMFELAQVKPGDVVVDLGSGDGILLIEAAQQKAHAIGYEINPFLVAKSRAVAKRLNLDKLIQVKKQNFWRVDLSQADVVMIFGITHIMPKLEKKLQRELKPGARVVCSTFKFPNWPPAQRKDGIYLYIKK